MAFNTTNVVPGIDFSNGLFLADGGVDDVAKEFIQAIAQHRFRNRKPDMVVA